MERVNIPQSLQSLGNVGKVQQHQHSAPIMQNLQNSDIDRQKQTEKAESPTEVDEAENLLVDPDEQKKQEQKQKKKKDNKKPDHENRGPKSGKFVDFSA